MALSRFVLLSLSMFPFSAMNSQQPFSPRQQHENEKFVVTRLPWQTGETDTVDLTIVCEISSPLIVYETRRFIHEFGVLAATVSFAKVSGAAPFRAMKAVAFSFAAVSIKSRASQTQLNSISRHLIMRIIGCLNEVARVASRFRHDAHRTEDFADVRRSDGRLELFLVYFGSRRSP